MTKDTPKTTPGRPVEKTLKDLDETELKALAYDQLSVIQSSQNNLTLINQELSSRK